jgi:glycosyltransferase involved in cell wall biosynthesis
MNVVAVTNVFPNPVEPHGGIFNLRQLAALRTLVQDLQVVAPVPTYPGVRLVARWAEFSQADRVPEQEQREGIMVHHPRFVFVPRLGLRWRPRLFARTVRPVLRRLRKQGQLDVLLATWAFPDAAGTALVARELQVPIVVKVHGSDIHLHGKRRAPRRWIARTLRQAAAVIAVSEPLAAEVRRLGITAGTVRIIPNGVDHQLFRPGDTAAARRRLGLPLDRPLILQVGNLKPVKGCDILLAAMPDLLRSHGHAPPLLLFVGDGPQRRVLEQEIRRQGLQTHVILTGARPHEELPTYYQAADVVTCASRSEGTPNVLLEALSCGKPVVASAVGGIPDLLREAPPGSLLPPEDPRALAKAIRKRLADPQPAEIWQRLVRDRSWIAGAQQIKSLLEQALHHDPSRQ